MADAGPAASHHHHRCGRTKVPLRGERVPDAFGFVMANLQRFVAGEDNVLDTDVHDSIKTMALVDAALKSSRLGGVVPETV